MIKKLAFALVAISFATTAQAGVVVGTQAIAALGDVNSTPNNDVTTDTQFTIGNLTTTTENTGDFATFVAGGLSLGNATLNVNDATTFTFGSAAFGTFTGMSVVEVAVTGVTRSFLITGMFDPGTLFPATHQDASQVTLALGFTQVAAGESISASATLVTTAVPEPSTVLALGTGLAFAGLAALRRKAAK